MKRIISLIITAVILTVFSVSAFAYDDGHRRKHYRHRHKSIVRVHIPGLTISLKGRHKHRHSRSVAAPAMNPQGPGANPPGPAMSPQGPGMNPQVAPSGPGR